MTVKSYPWPGVAPTQGEDAGTYTAPEWWAVWSSLSRSGGLIVPSAGTPLRTLSALTNIGVYYAVPNQLEVTDLGGLDVQVDTGAASVEGQYVYNDAAITLNLPVNLTDHYVVLRKNYTASQFTPPSYVSGEGLVPAYTTRPTWVSAIVQDTDRGTYWDTPLAKFTTSGVDITSLTDEREYVDAETKYMWVEPLFGWRIIAAMPADYFYTSVGSIGGIQFLNDESAFAHGHDVIPADFIKDFTSEAVYFAPSGVLSTKALYGQNAIAWGSCGNTPTSGGSVSTGFIAQVMGSVAGTYVCTHSITAQPSAGNLLRLRFNRSGADAQDTIDNYVVFIGWTNTYFGWK